jgi:predicted metalloenzyme YecM
MNKIYFIPLTVFAKVSLEGISWKTGAKRQIAIGTEGSLLASKMVDGKQFYLVRFRKVTCPMQVEDNQISMEKPNGAANQNSY